MAVGIGPKLQTEPDIIAHSLVRNGVLMMKEDHPLQYRIVRDLRKMKEGYGITLTQEAPPHLLHLL